MKLMKEEMYFSIWFRKGIFLIGDIVNEHGQILPIEALKKKYNFNPNVLDFHRIKLLVQKFIKIFKTGDLFNYTKPARPFHLQILFKSKKGCGDFYKILLKDIIKGPIEVKKWEPLVSENKNDFWRTIYKICFKSVPDNKYIWFQYKIINSILDTKYYLHKVKISECNKCQLCGLYPETIGHLFSQCSKVMELWKNLKHWISVRTGANLKLDETTKILGYSKYDSNFWPLNFVLILTRYYIYWCSKNKFSLNVFHLQKEVKRRYSEHKYLANIKGYSICFEKRWCDWQNLFTDI